MAAEMTVLFQPTVAGHHVTEGHLHAQGLEHPLVLGMEGYSIGPKAQLSYDILEVAEVYVKTRHVYEVKLSNTGSIPCAYLVRSANKEEKDVDTVIFHPPQGVIGVSETATVQIAFEPSQIGAFVKQFEYHLEVDFFSLCILPGSQCLIDHEKGLR